MKTADAVHHFWFVAHGPEDWFAGTPEFDAEIAALFGPTHRAVALGEASGWRGDARGRPAEIVVLDQFSRQLHRGRPEAFAQDKMALILAQELVASGRDRDLDETERLVAYLPYMHAESLVMQDEALRLYTALGNVQALEFARQHHQAIARFGRFPKRNAALGRASTPDELDYLAEIGDRAF